MPKQKRSPADRLMDSFGPNAGQIDRAHRATLRFHSDLALEEKLTELLGPYDAFDPDNDWNYPKREEP